MAASGGAKNKQRKQKDWMSLFQFEQLNLPARILAGIQQAQLTSLAEVLLMSAFEVQRCCGLNSEDANTLINAAALQIYPIETVRAVTLIPRTPISSEELTTCPYILRLSVGDFGLDKFLGGGLLSRGLLEIAGESATGKTQLCLQLCLTVQLPFEHGGLSGGAVYVCTEGSFPTRRLQQLLPSFAERFDFVQSVLSSRILIEHVGDIEELDRLLRFRLPKLVSDQGIRLVVIDSLAALFRAEFETTAIVDRSRILSKVASVLKKLSDEYHVAVVCVNQVTDQFEAAEHAGMTFKQRTGNTQLAPALGMAWSNCVNMRIMLSRRDSIPAGGATDTTFDPDSIHREMHIVLAPHLPNASVPFVVNHFGVMSRKL